jgi:sigma-E factor negative regulatory protein RseC
MSYRVSKTKIDIITIYRIICNMKEKGQVVETTSFGVKVALKPSEACKSCAACDFCQPAGGERVIEAENNIGAQIGDEVHIEVSPKTGLLAFFLLFGLPIILALIGLLIGGQYSDAHSILYGIAGLVLGLVIAKIINNLNRSKHKFLPKVVEILRRKGS